MGAQWALDYAGAGQRFRNLLLDMLQHHESVKRAEIMTTAKARNMELSEQDYTRHMLKNMKELCDSAGSNWHLKSGW